VVSVISILCVMCGSEWVGSCKRVVSCGSWTFLYVVMFWCFMHLYWCLYAWAVKIVHYSHNPGCCIRSVAPWVSIFFTTHSIHRQGDILQIYCEVREKTNKMQQLDVYYQHFLNMFQASLCPSSGDQDVCYCMWCAALVLLDWSPEDGHNDARNVLRKCW